MVDALDLLSRSVLSSIAKTTTGLLPRPSYAAKSMRWCFYTFLIQHGGSFRSVTCHVSTLSTTLIPDNPLSPACPNRPRRYENQHPTQLVRKLSKSKTNSSSFLATGAALLLNSLRKQDGCAPTTVTCWAPNSR